MSSKRLGDGIYLREHMFGPDAIASELKGHIPYSDYRFVGVKVVNGRAVEVIYDPNGKAPSEDGGESGPVLVTRTVDPAEVAPTTRPAEVAPDAYYENLGFQQLRALAKDKGIDASGTKGELLAKLKGA